MMWRRTINGTYFFGLGSVGLASKRNEIGKHYHCVTTSVANRQAAMRSSIFNARVPKIISCHEIGRHTTHASSDEV